MILLIKGKVLQHSEFIPNIFPLVRNKFSAFERMKIRAHYSWFPFALKLWLQMFVCIRNVHCNVLEVILKFVPIIYDDPIVSNVIG